METLSTQPKITPVKRFWQLLKPDSREIRNVYAYAIFSGGLSLTLPLGIQAVLTLIQGGQISTSWIVLLVLVLIAVLLSGVLQIFQLRITENLQQKIFTRAAFEFAYRLPKIKLESLYRHHAPELMNRFFDIISVQKGLSKILIEFSTAALHVLFGLILLSFYHPFFIVFSLILILLILAIFRFTAKRGLETSLEESKYKYKVAHWLEELARTSTTFKLAGKTDLPLHRTDAQVNGYLAARESHFKVLLTQFRLLVVFKVLVATGLLAIGGVLVMEQHMNIGQFVAAEIIILLVMNAVEKLILSLETIYDVLTALEKVGQVTDLNLEPTGGKDVQNPSGKGLEVALNGIHFSYPNQELFSIRNIDLTIPSGQRVVLTGHNGSGKSTLMYILAGLYDLSSGSISYNGLPKSNLDLESLRSVIGDSLTDEQLFEGTLLENITMGREAATFENVEWVINNLGLRNFIKSLPNGYNTILSPEGKDLAKSTIQKLLIARSIVDKPRLLLLEDALEHIDYKERCKILDFLTNRENDWTLVTVSNDREFAKRADRIILMKEGKIEADGTYQELESQINYKYD